MKSLLLPLASMGLLAGCSTHHHQQEPVAARLTLRAAEMGKERRLTTTQVQSRKRAAAQKDHLILGSWEAANFIPIAHQGAFGAILETNTNGDQVLPRFNKKHIAGREELSMSSLEKTVASDTLLDIDVTHLAGFSGKHIVLHHDAKIGRTTGRRPGKKGKSQPNLAELVLSELPNYGIRLVGGGYADILTLADFIEAFPDEAFSIETKTRTAAVNLVKFANDLPEPTRKKLMDRAMIYAIARPGDESALGPELATAEPTKILRDGLGDAAVIASSEAETTAFVMAYGIPVVSWFIRQFKKGPPLTLEGDVLGAPATGFRELPGIRKFPLIRSLPTISGRMMKEAHKQGVMVLPWTIDRKRALNRAVRIGADGAYSNDPRILNDLVREMGDTAKPVISRSGGARPPSTAGVDNVPPS